MTTSLAKAFAEAAKRSPAEQELLASRLLAELADEDDFDRAIAGSTNPKKIWKQKSTPAEHKARPAFFYRHPEQGTQLLRQNLGDGRDDFVDVLVLHLALGECEVGLHLVVGVENNRDVGIFGNL